MDNGNRDTVFNVGDFVRIRYWDDMMDEFGLEDDGDINCEMIFTTDMKFLCGREFYIGGITDIAGSKVVSGLESDYYISFDMIEKIEERESEELEEAEELNNFLGGYKVV